MRILLLSVCFSVSVFLNAAEKELNFYNWDDYMPSGVIEKFQNATGIKVNLSTYDSNETMYKALTIGKKSYDLIVPSTYFVHRMIKGALLQSINISKISNFKNLNPQLLNKTFDPQNRFSIPYMWGSSGIIVNNKFISTDTIRAYKDLWKPELKDKIGITNDLRDVFGMSLKSLGYSCNDESSEHIKQSYEHLKELFPNIKMIFNETPSDSFINNDVQCGISWNGEAYNANSVNPEINYIYPEEGVILWVDSLAIPVSAKNVENAHIFINFILNPEIAMEIASETGYSTPNIAAFKLMDESMQKNPILYPDESILKKSESLLDVGRSIAVFEKYWKKLNQEFQNKQ